MLSDLLRMPLRALSALLKLALGILLLVAAAETVLVGILTMFATFRQKRREEAREPFPAEKQPEI